MNERQLAIEALNLEGYHVKMQQGGIIIHQSCSCINKEIVFYSGNSSLSCHQNPCHKSSFSVDDLHCICCKIDSETIVDEEISVIEDRGYYLSTDDLLENRRFKLNRAKSDIVDIDKIIENSWLKTDLFPRRASVFAYRGSPPLNMDLPTTIEDFKYDSIKSFSSCSSSNDTSDANSNDIFEERKKLAQQLEGSSPRMQSRSPTHLTFTSFDDLKAVTPTINEQEQNNTFKNSFESSEDGVYKKDSTTNSLLSVQSMLSGSVKENIHCLTHCTERRKSSLRRQSGVIIPNMSPTFGTKIVTQNVPTIPTVQVSDTDSTKTYQKDLSSISKDVDLEGNLLQASMNLSSMSSRTSSVGSPDSKDPLRSKHDHRKSRRPYTITGIRLSNPNLPESPFSNCDQNSNVGDDHDIQEAIDSLKEMKLSLVNIPPEELENTFNGINFIYQTDRPSVIARALDANKKCNMALANVDQEFQVLKHLINSFSQVSNAPSELVRRVRTSVTVLENCVEYLSAKSEALGSVEQEVKISSVIDVMSEYISMLIKQREKHVCEFEELKLWKEANTKNNSNGSFDQSRSKRNTPIAKDPKTRFQTLARTAALKSRVVRNFSTSDQKEALSTSGRKDLYTEESLELPPSGQAENNSPNTNRHNSLQTLLSTFDQTDSDKPKSKDIFGEFIDEYKNLNTVITISQYIIKKIMAVKNLFCSLLCNMLESTEKLVLIIIGFGITLALLLPWLLSPVPLEHSSFSIPISRKAHLPKKKNVMSTK